MKKFQVIKLVFRPFDINECEVNYIAVRGYLNYGVKIEDIRKQ
jgi:hypothetical protein